MTKLHDALIASASTDDGSKRKRGDKAACDMARQIGAVVHAIADAAGQADGRLPDASGLTECAVADIDGKRRYLGFPNGIVDLQTGRLLSAADGRHALVTTMLPDPYDPDATHDDVTRLFAHLTDAQRQWIILSLAHSLTGDTSVKRFYVIVGPKNGGKSTLVEAVLLSVGVYGASLATGALTPARGGRGANAHTADMHTLVPPVRVGFIPELDRHQRFDVARLKSLTGSDTLTYRPAYAPLPLQVKSLAAIWIVGNDLPSAGFGLTDDAMRYRFTAVEYPAVPDDQRDDRMLTAWRHDVDGSAARRQALVALLVASAVALRGNAPAMPAEIAAQTASVVERDLGELRSWIMASVLPGRDTDVLASADVWRAACVVFGTDPDDDSAEIDGFTKVKFGKLVREIVGLPGSKMLKRQGVSVRGWRGYRLADDAMTDDDGTEIDAGSLLFE